jgi:hypothetical protein
LEFDKYISHGTANNSFPKSRHCPDVISVPDFSCASTTRVHRDNHATISFLIGKLYGFPTSQIGNIDKTQPPHSTISLYNFIFPVG